MWSPGLTQVMCEMVRLLKEQDSLRRVLDDLYLLDDPSPSPPTSPLDPASPPMGNERESTHSELLEESNPSTDGSDLVGEVTDDDDPKSKVVGVHDPVSEVIETLREVRDLTFPGLMSERELVEELVKTQTDLERLRVKARRDVAVAVREVSQPINFLCRVYLMLEKTVFMTMMAIHVCVMCVHDRNAGADLKLATCV